MLPNAKHVAHILSSDIVSAPLQHSLFSSDASSSAAAEPTAGPLAPSDELDEASSFAVILGVSAFIVLIVTYPLWKRKILLNFCSSLPHIIKTCLCLDNINDILSFVQMNVAGLYPVSDGDGAFCSADASAHDQSGKENLQYNTSPSKLNHFFLMMLTLFDLHQTGNKVILIEWLEVFSRDPDSWDRLRPGAHTSHKGPQLVGAATATTVTDQSKDMRTSTEVAALLPWAEMIGMKYPYQTMAGAEPSHLLLATSINAPSPVYIDELQDTIIQNVSSRIISLVQDTLHEPSAVWCPPVLGAEGFTHPGAETIAVESSAPSASLSLAIGKPRLLHLGDGTILQVDSNKIPDPPAISFAHNIACLNSMWDDDTEHWKGLSVIVIHSHPITVKYWPVLYRYGKDKQWKGMKKKWSDWQVSTTLESSAASD
ncbi:hypothetical protein BDR07DRAFT_1493930 [Suillus spraguei]|nr:hypothetical protein BDR07DRAFT_1493930 [Suillus spraguei]